MKMILKTMVCLAVAFSGTAGAANYSPEKSQASLALKVPGNPAVEYPLTLSKLSDSYFDYEWKAKEKIPVTIFQQISTVDDKQQVTVVLTAMEDVYFNFEERIRTDFVMMIASFICQVSGIVVIYVHLKRLHRFILPIAG